MVILSVIRRSHLRDRVPIREIARRTGLSRNTIKKYLAGDTVEPHYPHRNSTSKRKVLEKADIQLLMSCYRASAETIFAVNQSPQTK